MNANHLRFNSAGNIQAGNTGFCDSIPIYNNTTSGFVGQSSPVAKKQAENEADKTIDQIALMLAEFDAEQGIGVSGVHGTVGKSWWRKIKDKIKIPTMKDVKREFIQASNPKHIVEQFGKVTKKNLVELKDWGERILKNPSELLHPPLPKTGNKTIDKEIISRIEKVAKKADPTWQLGDVIRSKVIDPALSKKDEKKEREASKKVRADAKRDIERADRELKKVREQKKRAMRILGKAKGNRGIFRDVCPTGMKRLGTEVFENSAYALCSPATKKKAKKRRSAFSRVRKFKGRTSGIYLPELNYNNNSYRNGGII